jgi:hypothetical protein
MSWWSDLVARMLISRASFVKCLTLLVSLYHSVLAIGQLKRKSSLLKVRQNLKISKQHDR